MYCDSQHFKDLKSASIKQSNVECTVSILLTVLNCDLFAFSHLYFTAYGNSPFIARSSLAGRSRQVLVSSDVSADSLTLDFSSAKMFWIDKWRSVDTRLCPSVFRQLLIVTFFHVKFDQYDMITRKWCKIRQELVLFTDKKSHRSFLSVPKLMTLSDLEQPCDRHHVLFHTKWQLSASNSPILSTSEMQHRESVFWPYMACGEYSQEFTRSQALSDTAFR